MADGRKRNKRKLNEPELFESLKNALEELEGEKVKTYKLRMQLKAAEGKSYDEVDINKGLYHLSEEYEAVEPLERVTPSGLNRNKEWKKTYDGEQVFEEAKKEVEEAENGVTI